MSFPSLPKQRMRWIATVFFFLSGLISASWSARIPEIQKKFLLNDAKWGVMLFALPLGLVAGLILSSYLVAKYGSRRMMVLASIVFSITLLLLSLCNTTWQLAIVLFMFGICRNATNISINTYAVELQRSYTRPIVSVFHGIWSLAGFAAVGIGAFMIARSIIPEWHFLIITIICLVIVFIFRRKKSEKSDIKNERRPLLIMPTHYLLLLGLIAFCSMICEGTMFDWSVSYFQNNIKAEKGMVTAGYTSFIVALTLGRLAGDKVIHRFGPVSLLAINAVIMALGFLLAILFPFLLPACIGFLLVGLGNSILIPMTYMLASKTTDMPASYAIASVTMIGYIGFLIGPPIVGSISEHFGMQWAFGLMGLLSLCIVVIALFVKKVTTSNPVLLHQTLSS